MFRGVQFVRLFVYGMWWQCSFIWLFFLYVCHWLSFPPSMICLGEFYCYGSLCVRFKTGFIMGIIHCWLRSLWFPCLAVLPFLCGVLWPNVNLHVSQVDCRWVRFANTPIPQGQVKVKKCVLLIYQKTQRAHRARSSSCGCIWFIMHHWVTEVIRILCPDIWYMYSCGTTG